MRSIPNFKERKLYHQIQPIKLGWQAHQYFAHDPAVSLLQDSGDLARCENRLRSQSKPRNRG